LELLEIVDSLNVLTSVQFVAANTINSLAIGQKRSMSAQMLSDSDRPTGAQRTRTSGKVDTLSPSRLVDYQTIKETLRH